jgi:uncharacterized membrane protein
LVQGIYFTLGFFAFFVERFWRWRRRGAFWQSLSALLILHVLGICLWSIRVQPLFVWQWMILFVPESFLFGSFLDWSTRRFGRLHRRKTLDSRAS